MYATTLPALPLFMTRDLMQSCGFNQADILKVHSPGFVMTTPPPIAAIEDAVAAVVLPDAAMEVTPE